MSRVVVMFWTIHLFSVGSKGSDDLMKVGLNNFDPAVCNDTFSPMIGGRKLRVGITSDSMLCVGDLEGGKDTCKVWSRLVWEVISVK